MILGFPHCNEISHYSNILDNTCVYIFDNKIKIDSLKLRIYYYGKDNEYIETNSDTITIYRRE